jgi:hypothetical protein
MPFVPFINLAACGNGTYEMMNEFMSETLYIVIPACRESFQRRIADKPQ